MTSGNLNENRILVCGGRDFDDYSLLCNSVYEICYLKNWTLPNTVFISGKAKGADSLGEKYAKEWGAQVLEFPADWNKYGKRAGPIRNQQILDEGKPTLVIAFPTKNSRGTWHMIKIAKDAGVETIVVES